MRLIRSLLVLALLPGLASCGKATAAQGPGAQAPRVAAEDAVEALDSGSPGPGDSAPAADAAASTPENGAAPRTRPLPPPAVVPAAKRVVAIGDVHGDIAATRKALQLAGAIDEADNWIGGALVVVQVGDQLDRGDDEKDILLLLDALADKAHAAGGALYTLNGNHETMNVSLNFNYVTPGGWADFADTPLVPDDALLQNHLPAQRGRVSAFRPGGIYARLLGRHNTVQQVGDTVFVHGGLLPKHVSYGVGKINSELQAWMRGEAKRPEITTGEDSPVWSRHYSQNPDAADCQLAKDALAALGAERMVVAHTVQAQGINSACGGLVWRIDVGMAKHYGGKAQVLVIEGDAVSIVK